MKRMLKNVLPILAAGMVFTSCEQELISSSVVNNDASVAPRSEEVTLQTERYILSGNKLNGSLAKVRQRLQEIGAQESGYLPQVGMMFVGSTNPSFEAEMKGLGLNVAADFEVELPQSVGETVEASADEGQAAGSGNTLLGRLWGMDAIDAPQAWAAGYKGKGVRVAVLDGGYYMNHPDLSANINKGLSRNFVNLNDLGQPYCNSLPECDPSDPSFKKTGFSHGTHVAGTIAALDNTIGVIGVAPEAEIVAVKVLSDYAGGGLVSWIVQGIVYAADNGADVINMSLGGVRTKGGGKGANLVMEGIKAYNEAIQYASQKGSLVVVAAGNNGFDFDHNGPIEVFPGGSPQALTISATAPYGWFIDPTTDLDVPSSYTNFGASRIEFAAPGGDFDYPGSAYVRDMVLSTSGPSQYYYAAGTSMAAPHASGVAALIIGKNGGSMNPTHVKAALRASADDLGKPGKDPYFGLGRVNAFKAVQ